MPKGPLTRIAGPILLAVLLATMVVLRISERRQADHLLAGEAMARQTIASLYAASLDAVRSGRAHPGLRGAIISGLPDMSPLPELGSDQITYARDGVYMYGAATNPHRDATTGELVHGYILRAWPLHYGKTGDAEFQLTESGVLWEGQNRLGRSATDYGFPPAYPAPELGQPGAAWWPIRLPDHK